MAPVALIIGRVQDGTLETSYGRALSALKWTVHCWDPGEALSRLARPRIAARAVADRFGVDAWLKRTNIDLLQTAVALEPDLVLVIGTHGLRAGSLGQLRVRLPRTRVFCLYPDPPHGLDHERILSLPLFDRVLTITPAWTHILERLGAANVGCLYLAADTELHRPISSDRTQPLHHVSFIGSWRPERQALLEQMPEFDIRVWGSESWRRHTGRGSPLRRSWGGEVSGRDFARVCADSAILLNLIDVTTWPGPNMRSFEQPACRAFSLSTRTPALAAIFTEGTTVACFGSVGEAKEKIRYYLDHEREREDIAEAAYELVVNGGHTYVDRARALVDMV